MLDGSDSQSISMLNIMHNTTRNELQCYESCNMTDKCHCLPGDAAHILPPFACHTHSRASMEMCPMGTSQITRLQVLSCFSYRSLSLKALLFPVVRMLGQHLKSEWQEQQFCSICCKHWKWSRTPACVWLGSNTSHT